MKNLTTLIIGLAMTTGCSSQRQEAHHQPEINLPQEPTIFISGEFHNPGKYAWTNGMRLQDAIQSAGGFTDFSTKRVLLKHQDGSAERFRMGRGYNTTNNSPLNPGDSIINFRD